LTQGCKLPSPIHPDKVLILLMAPDKIQIDLMTCGLHQGVYQDFVKTILWCWWWWWWWWWLLGRVVAVEGGWGWLQRCAITFVGVRNFAQFGLRFWIYSSVFHKLLRIMKIFTYTPLMTGDISAISFWANILSEAHSVCTLFQSCIIPFYIKIPHQFWPFTYLHYKTAVSQ
jgi:hypothetical protein